jgi:hypothetical protein
MRRELSMLLFYCMTMFWDLEYFYRQGPPVDNTLHERVLASVPSAGAKSLMAAPTNSCFLFYGEIYVYLCPGH